MSRFSASVLLVILVAFGIAASLTLLAAGYFMASYFLRAIPLLTLSSSL